MNEKSVQTLRRLVAYGAFMPDVAGQYPLNRRVEPLQAKVVAPAHAPQHLVTAAANR